ncbi:protoporphyrinogen oxidase-like [Penaeus chinensis]|uniref:protoporphyrinogen oxidase-like n=1 Tax=Penaeus chinensis TaxID=139456 RepID=UPI001FB74802|nr:protoporphyrinogen oxidase-like [Penaeus chinensis]XP_047488374.1 protoporphyrinogen oxidase-like [Penaeus chinensis]XP_047488381.1 protoporphyrinogen oxidase-like [Penaeus chinensis]
MTVTVLGGGISGLAAAHYLRTINPSSRIVVLEASHRLGGWIDSTKHNDGVVYEGGPRTLRVVGNAGANTLALAESLGLRDKVRSVRYGEPSAKNRMIKVNGSLHKLPNSLKTALTKIPPFSKPLALSAISDLRAKKVLSDDESLFSFVNRRFGPDVAKYAIDPLARGVFAGNARDLSVKALAKRMHEVEQKHGSVLKGFIKDRKNAEKPDPGLAKCDLVQQARKEKWAVWSLQDGLETLVKTLAESLEQDGVEIRRNTPVLGIQGNQRHLVVQTNGEEIHTERVISCLPANHLSQVVSDLDTDLSIILSRIPFVTVAVVTLEYTGDRLNEQAFGYLVPSTEPSKVLGVIFDTCTFSQGDRTILTVMMGGYWFKQYFGESPTPESFLDVALKEVESVLKIKEAPVRHNVNILKDCIPQYIVGHSEMVINARKLIRHSKIPLVLAGNSYDGVGVNDAVMSAKKAVLQ